MRISLKDIKTRLHYRLTIFLILLSAVVTLLMTSLQVYSDYFQELAKIDQSIQQVYEILLPPLEKGEPGQILNILETIRPLLFIQHLSVDKGQIEVVSYLASKEEKGISRKLPLPNQKGETLHVVVNSEQFNRQIINKAIISLMTHTLMATVIVLFVLWFFSKKVTSSLNKLVSDTRGLEKDALLSSEEPLHEEHVDEFVWVNETIHRIYHHLQFSYQQVHEQEETTQHLFKTTLLGLGLWHLDGTLTKVNPAFAQILGRSATETLALNYWNDVVVELDINSEKNYLQRLQVGERYGPMEKEFQHKDGYLVPVRVFATLVEIGGQLCVWSNIENIAAHKRALRELQHAKHKAEEANRSKSQFLANMGHELRTPMTTIVGYSEMLEEEIKESGRSDLLRDIKNIRTSARHLLSLIDGILDISKIEAGKMDLYVENFEVQQMIDHVVQTIQPLIDNKANTLQVRTNEALGKMHTDLVKVRQILLNLLSNASKFSEQGAIKLDIRRSIEDNDEWMTFIVSDEGIGMTTEQQATLFQLFTQPDASMRRKHSGAILGLELTKHFTEMLGGTITVESEFSKGSRFTVRLPAQLIASKSISISNKEENQVRVPSLPAESGVVLVIDDDEVVRNLLRAYLSKIGYQVVLADNGQDGIALAKKLHPNAITLDVMMPGMDGWDVLSQLKAEPELAHIPVIVLTMLEEKDIGYSLGAAEYLTKPISRDQLTQVLRKYRSGNAAHIVMVVEDDDTTREMMVRMLHRVGWQVIEAQNGEVALRLLDKHHPDLILLDLMMPEMDGFEFIIHLRQHKVCATIPVVVVTARDITVEDRLWLSHRVDSVFQKGAYNRDELLADLRALLANTMSRTSPPK